MNAILRVLTGKRAEETDAPETGAQGRKIRFAEKASVLRSSKKIKKKYAEVFRKLAE